MAKIKNDFPRVKSNHIERRATHLKTKLQAETHLGHLETKLQSHRPSNYKLLVGFRRKSISPREAIIKENIVCVKVL